MDHRNQAGSAERLCHGRGRDLERSAAWTIAVTPANTGMGTELSATWTASPSNATDATYTIYDGTQASGTMLGTVVVDQTKAPSGTAVSSSQFQELGVFFPTLSSSGTGTLTVVLNASSADSRVVADAIGSAAAWASTRWSDSVRTGAFVPAHIPEHAAADNARRGLRREREYRSDLFPERQI